MSCFCRSVTWGRNTTVTAPPSQTVFSSLASIPVTACIPVLLNEKLQCSFVGEHHIWIHAEVVVARGILAAKIPNEIKNTDAADSTRS